MYNYKETEKNESRKVKETKDRIKDAFLEIYAEKQIEKISIKEITERAGLNRGTFYVYFLDIYDVREQVEKDIFTVYGGKANDVIDAIFSGRDFMSELPDTTFFMRNKKYFNVIFGQNTNSCMFNRLKGGVKAFVIKKLDEYGYKIDKNTDYVLEYVIGAHTNIIAYWFRGGMDIPLEEVVAFLKDISVTGPVGFLIKK